MSPFLTLLKYNIRYASFFWLFNGLLYIAIGIRYWQWFSIPTNDNDSLVYLLCLHYGLFSLFALLLLLIHGLLCWLPSFWFKSLGILIGLIGAVALLADTFVFAQYRFHLNGFIFSLFFAEDIIKLSWLTWLIVIFITVGLLITQLINCWLANKTSQHPLSLPIRSINLSLLVGCLITSQLIHVWEDANYRNKIPSYTQYFPLYYPITAKRKLVKWGWVDPATIQEREEEDLDDKHHGSLNYPLQPINHHVSSQPYNILFILIDAWRYDDFNATVTPNLQQLSLQSTTFQQHLSGGNSTLAGIYSLFYSIPSTYWTATQYSGKRPVFMQTLAEQGYQFAIYGSSALNHPPFDRTVFRNIPNLRIKNSASTVIKRDREITSQFSQFLQQRDTAKPFMGFLFYDAAHGYDLDHKAIKPFKPYWKRVDHILLNNSFDPLPYHNRYRNALYNDDQMIGSIIEQLKQQNLLDNTIIVVTADHAEEFNDNGKNYWGHGSNYSMAQVHVPLFIYWPDRQANTVDYRTSHYDIIPTLMQQALGVSNDSQDYSIGHNLFSATPARQDIIIGSYYNYAVISPNEITMVQPSGNLERVDPQLNSKSSRDLTGERLQAILKQMARFFK